MSQENVTYVQYTCDGCGTVVAVPEWDAPAPGYHGDVLVVTELGGTGGRWFAHAAKCIRRAVETAADRNEAAE